MNSNQQLTIELKTGNKCEGTLVNIDKEKMLINLANAKRMFKAEDGSEKEEFFPHLEISKEDIKEVKIVQYESKEEPLNTESKQSANLNAIPESFKNNVLNANNQAKSYDKTDSFFDSLTPMTNKDAQHESIRYNDKNCETFDLPKDSNNYSNSFSHNRFRGNNRGRFNNNRNQRDGYNHSYQSKNQYHQRGSAHTYNNYNNNYSHSNQGNNFPGSNNYGMHESNNNFRGGRGGLNPNRRNYNYNNYSQNFPQQNFNNHQFQKQVQMFAGNNPFPMEMSHQNDMDFKDFIQPQGFYGGNYNNNYTFGYQRGRGQNRRNFNRGGNRNFSDKIPNADFNSINENNDNNDHLDDDYNMSIYDKPSFSAGQNPIIQDLSAYELEQAEKNFFDKI